MGSQPTGLHYGTLTYNTFAISTLTYVSQLERPSATVKQTEKKALRKAVAGPAQWIMPEDLWYLEEYGQQSSFKSIDVTARAAQVRTAVWEARSSGGLRVRERARDLRSYLGSAEYLGRRRFWPDWYKRAHVFVLEEAVVRFESMGTSIQQLELRLAGGRPKPWSAKLIESIRRRFQREAAK